MVWKKTKKSEKEVDIKPMIYGSEIKEDYIYLYLATGSEQNLKPDLVMEIISEIYWAGRCTVVL